MNPLNTIALIILCKGVDENGKSNALSLVERFNPDDPSTVR